MLSICIPIHNWDVTKLVRDLKAQADKLKVAYEILLLDDASDYEYQKKNAQLDFLDHVTYLQSYINMGRSVVRNTLAVKSKHPYLLFMDCDVTVTHRDYLKKYLEALPAKVVVGGAEFKPKKPRKENVLRWKYGIVREQVPAEIRRKDPNAAFSTFNFIIEKEIFDTVQFDETLQGYGHEDTLFGLDLEAHGITISHIDNPLRHDVSRSSNQFLKQTRNSIDNLLIIADKVENRDRLEQSITLLRTYRKLEKRHLLGLYRLFYQMFGKMIEKNLRSPNPKIRAFDLYKLGYLVEKMKAEKNS